MQIRHQAIDLCVPYITPVDESQQPKTKQPRDDVLVECSGDGSIQGWINV